MEIKSLAELEEMKWYKIVNSRMEFKFQFINIYTKDNIPCIAGLHVNGIKASVQESLIFERHIANEAGLEFIEIIKS